MNEILQPPQILQRPVNTTDAADLSVRWTLLALCTLVLTAALALRIEGTSRVVVPWIDWRLPGVCWLNTWVGIRCPGCGLTRSFISLADGHWQEAWQYNAAGPLLFLLVVMQIPYQSYQLWRYRSGLPPWRLGTYATIPVVVFAGALFAQWLVRLCAQFVG